MTADTFAPVLLFTYKRLDTLQQAVKALQKCRGAADSGLFVFSDAAKSEKDREQVEEVRSYLETIRGFRDKTIIKRKTNYGLARSIIEGVSEIIDAHGKVIVLEDDLLVSEDFLLYVNSALDFYEKEDKVISVSGFSPKISIPRSYTYDVYFSPRSTSWGWGTWKNRWQKAEWDISDFPEHFKSRKQRRKFSRLGSNLYPMLKKQYRGEIDSWAVRWVYHQFKQGSYAVYPSQSKVLNVGFGGEATHTKSAIPQQNIKTDFKTGDLTYSFPERVCFDEHIMARFRSHYGYFNRVLTKARACFS